ncbi:MAG: response regulator transcription factor [Chitinophagaceae bacterium]|nr:response regulator transcription factor [Chitinophagaceae bacterium]
MKILIVDNEPELRYVLREMIQQLTSHHAIEEADGVQQGIQKIRAWNPDLVLLDVEMNDGTGFDLLQQLDQLNFQLVFTTAHNKYAVQAFKFSAIDYLLKPIDPVDLLESLRRAEDKMKHGNLQHQFQILMQQMNQQQASSDKQIVLKDIDKTYFVKMNDIIYCEADGSYTKFYISNTEPIYVSRNLRSYEELLEPAGFIRSHHSCLVNPKKIKLFDRKIDNGVLILEDGHQIPVSQRKRDYVLQALENR